MEIGFRLGKTKLFNYINAYRFGEKSGIDFLGEAKGIVFKESKVGPVELATSSFGQGNSATPIQLTNAMSAAINGGQLMKPYVLKTIKNEQGDIVFENKKTVKRNVISKETSDIMRYSLEHVSALGTGHNAYVDGYRVGGETGVFPSCGTNLYSHTFCAP